MKKTDLMGLGMPPFLAERMADCDTNIIVAAAGTSVGTATALGRSQYLVSVQSGTGGVKLPPVGGDNGCLIGDDFYINNQSGATITVYASGANFSLGGASTAGATGVAVSNHQMLTVFVITATGWFGGLD